MTDVYVDKTQLEDVRDTINIWLTQDIVPPPDDGGGGGEVTPSFSVEEEGYYQILCGLTSPAWQHMKRGSFSFTPSNTIYSSFKNLVRFGGMGTNYIDLYTPPNPLTLVQRFTTSDTITGIGNSSAFMYVNDVAITAIQNARDLWFKRMYWLLTTTPTRIKVENVLANSNGSTAIPVGTYGSLVRIATFQGGQAGILFSANGETLRGVWMCSIPFRKSTSWEYLQNFVDSEIMLPLSASMDGVSYTWSLVVTGTNQDDLTSYCMIEKYDLPDWW